MLKSIQLCSLELALKIPELRRRPASTYERLRAGARSFFQVITSLREQIYPNPKAVKLSACVWETEQRKGFELFVIDEALSFPSGFCAPFSNLWSISSAMSKSLKWIGTLLWNIICCFDDWIYIWSVWWKSKDDNSKRQVLPLLWKVCWIICR